MTNYIDDSGIHIESLTEIQNRLIDGFKTIYNLENIPTTSPDMQMIQLIALEKLDILNFIVANTENFYIQNAIGANLDNLLQLSYLERRAGTYTLINVEIVTDRALNLNGIDGNYDNIINAFKVQDAEGNQFILQQSQIIASPGTYTFIFQAEKIGEVLVLPNTVNVFSTIMNGIISVNNPSATLQIGINEEADAQLRQRHFNVIGKNSVGFFQSIYSGIKNLENVLDIKLFENNTNAINSLGMPSFSFWVIAKGGNSTEIANVIYLNRNVGQMYGDTEVEITQIDGSIFTVKFDYAISEEIYLKMTLSDLQGFDELDFDWIKDKLVENVVFNINEIANNTNVISYLNQLLGENIYINTLQFSLNDIDYFNTLDTSSVKNYFILTKAKIDIAYS